MLKKNYLLGVGITNETEDKILEYVYHELEKENTKLFLVTPNPEIIVYAQKHKAYKAMLNKAEVALPDGVGVFLASLLMGAPFKERIPGVDFMEEVCKKCRTKPLSIGFLGGGPGVAKRTAECLLQRYPWIKVRWVGEEWEIGVKSSVMKENDTKRTGNISVTAPTISAKDPIDILFVAFGFPKQEEWIYQNLEKLPVRSAMGVGGAFDYVSGEVVRAPYIIRAMGFEWLYRLVRQPWRFKRQLALGKFVFLVIKEVIQNKRSH